MRKNSLIWSIALFLVILSLPIAHAQFTNLFAGGNLLLVLLNSAIVGIVLFMLQAFLIPGKADRERTAVYVAIIGGALLVGFMFGSQTWIWQHPLIAKFLNVFVLVNALIISTLAYFILGMMKFNDKVGASKEGIGGYAILLFLISLVFAFYIGNKFIWEVATVQQFIGYLFGKDGIFNPKAPEYRLWVFITSFVLLGYFFSVYLGQKVAGSKFITYALAATLAASLATAGVGLGVVVKIGEFIFLIIIADALKDKIADGKYSWGVAFFIVGWSSASLTAAFGSQYEGVIGSFMAPILRYYGLITSTGPTGFGPLLLSPPVLLLVAIFIAMDFVAKEDGYFHKIGEGGFIVWAILLLISNGFSIGFGNWSFIGFWIFIPIAIVVVLILIISRAVKREKSVLAEGKSRGWQEIKRKLRQNRAAAWVMRKVFRLRNESFPDELPFDIKDMRLEIYTLMNWMLRHEVWMRKGAAVTDIKKEVKKAEELLGKERPTEEDILAGMKRHIEGTRIIAKGDYWDRENEKDDVGWGRFYYVFVLLMNQLRKEIIQTNFSVKPVSDRPAVTQAADFVSAEGEGGKIIGPVWDLHKTRYGRYLSGLGRYKGWLITKANKQLFLDMLNMYGTYKRGYLFAKSGAKAEYYSYKFEKVPDEDKDHTVTRSIDWKKVEKIAENVPDEDKEDAHGEELLELNIYGYSISDINKIEVEGINLAHIRRFRVGYIDPADGKYKSDVSELHLSDEESARFQKVLTFSEKDWAFATQDMLTGVFHPLSKRVDNYQKHFDIIHEKFSTAPFDRPLKPSEVAFDREALKIPHALNYWGRKKYYEDSPEGSEIRQYPANPYPGISVQGLWDFIFKYSTAAGGNPERTKELLNNYFKQGYNIVDTTHQEKKGG